MARVCAFTDVSVAEMLSFLGASHERGGARSIWRNLPDFLFQRIGSFILEPLCKEFVRWPSMASPSDGGRTIAFGMRLLRSLALQQSDLTADEVALCGPPMPVDSGVYEIEFEVAGMLALDGFCRVDVGLVLDPNSRSRCASGIRWEAGDGDVFIASDAGGADEAGKPGWLGGDERIDQPILPRWDKVGSLPGLVLDTTKRCLLFTLGGRTLELELPLPMLDKNGPAPSFCVAWSGGTAARLTIRRLRRTVLGH